MKKIDALLAITVIITIVLLFWPFAVWADTLALILRVISSFAAQTLLFRIAKRNIIKTIPAILTGAFAAWGTYLYFTSPNWCDATFWGSLIADYVSPFVCCTVVLIVYLLMSKKASNENCRTVYWANNRIEMQYVDGHPGVEEEIK